MNRQLKLLIVDDENQILATYKSFFDKRGFLVETATNGEEGLAKLRGGEFDVAIVDILMPKMDGLTLVEKVSQEGIDTSIIILTGHGEKEHAVKAINLGIVEAWFEKATIRMNDLFEKVKSVGEVIPIDEVRRILSKLPENDKEE